MNQQPKRILAAGHICIDVTPVFPHAHLSFAEALSPGKLTHVDAADIHTGGSVANTGLALKLLGADVQLAGKVGDDPFGAMIADRLRKYGAESGLLVDKSGSTSYSIVIAPPGVDRIFLHHPGVNDTFISRDIPEAMLEAADHLHFGYPPLMRRMYENDGEELFSLLRRAKLLGLSTSLDMAAMDPASEAGQLDWQTILSRILPLVDFFVPSIEELCFMLDRPRYDDWLRRADGSEITRVLDPQEDIAPLAEKCLALGAKAVLLKCGAPGMYLCTADAGALSSAGRRAGLDAAAWANHRSFHRSYKPGRILSGTGAGDTSIAAFLLAMLEGCPPDECVQLAAATGACCVQAYDALSGLQPLEELRQRIAQGWEHV
ncbi:MAG: carbohydrate kinase family protein [Clostridiales bacterium]|nr:carbohydrate kinase family protein [Clostridiales bacterium]